MRTPIKAAAAAVMTLGLLLGCTTAPADHSATPSPTVSSVDFGSVVRQMVLRAAPSGPYRDPTDDERATGEKAVKALLAHPDKPDGYAKVFGRIGFDATVGEDGFTGRRYALLISDNTTERAWGAIVMDLSSPVDVVVEVPHSGFDINTDLVGVDLYRAHPGSILLVAGAHRQAAGGLGDVAHNDLSMFQVIATTLAGRDLPQVQLHGFADANLPGADVALSNGQAGVTALHSSIAEELTLSGLTVCAAWQEKCGRLEGTTNVQGLAAAEHGDVFVHVESSWSVRGYKDRRALLVKGLAAALARR